MTAEITTTAKIEQPPATTARIRNGVDLAALADAIRAIQHEPGLGEFRFRAANQWLDGGHNQATIGKFYGLRAEQPRSQSFVLDADEPPVLLGEDRGPNPVEYVLAALSACLTTTLVYHAAAHGIEIEEVSSEYEGELDLNGFLDLDPTVRRGYRQIRAKFRVKSQADEQKLLELLRKSPVYDIVSNPTPVQISVERVAPQ